MKIGIDTQSTWGHKTGIGLYTAQLLRTLRQIAPQHEYVELSSGRAEEMSTDQRLRWQQFGLPRRARASRVDLLHVTGFDAPRWKPCPVVLTVHDLIGLLFPANLPPISRFYWNRWLPRSIRWADQIIADSQHTKGDVNRLLGISPEQIEVIHLGVDQRFRPVQDRAAVETVRDKYGLPRMFILYVGTVEPRKGIDTLITAYAHLPAETPYHLVIAGQRGWYTEPLYQQVHALDLSHRVHFTGYVAEEDLPPLYRLARIFVYPSRYEGFGLPALEAMACGVPVVCTDSSSLPEVVGAAAYMVSPNEPESLAVAIQRILNDDGLQAKMRTSGLAQAAHFTWEETARKTLQVYESML